MTDDVDRWLEAELERGLGAVTREPAPPAGFRRTGAHRRPRMVLRTLVTAAGAKALTGGTAAVLAAGALAGVAVIHEAGPGAGAAHPGAAATTHRPAGTPAGTDGRSHAPAATATPIATPAAGAASSATTATPARSAAATPPGQGDEGHQSEGHGGDHGDNGQGEHGKAGSGQPSPHPIPHGHG